MVNQLIRWSGRLYLLGILSSFALTYWAYSNFKNNFEKFDQVFTIERSQQREQMLLKKMFLEISLLTTSIALQDERNVFTILEALKVTSNEFTKGPDIQRMAPAIKDLLPLLERVEAKLTAKTQPSRELIELATNVQKLTRESASFAEADLRKSFEIKSAWIQDQDRIQSVLKWSFLVISILLGFLSLLKASISSLETERQETAKLNGILINSLSEALLLVLKDGTIATANVTAANLLGLSTGALTGQSVSRFFRNLLKSDGSPYKTSMHPFLTLAQADRPYQRVIIGHPRESRTQWLEVNSQPLIAGATKSASCLITLSDVTDRVEQQKMIEEQQAQLVKSSKLSALGEMAAGIAHEINNPLLIIHMEADTILETAEEKEASSEEVLQSSKIILKTVDRISKIVKGLKTFSREGTADPLKPESLNQIINETLFFSEQKLKSRNISLTLEVEDNLTIDCRGTQISQVILNLINNASDAIADKANPWIKLKAFSTNDFIQIEVIDSGAGLPESAREKLFQPFFTTKAVGHGTGLGLSICKGIIDSHKGKLWVDHQRPNTTFIIELPKTQVSAEDSTISA